MKSKKNVLNVAKNDQKVLYLHRFAPRLRRSARVAVLAHRLRCGGGGYSSFIVSFLNCLHHGKR